LLDATDTIDRGSILHLCGLVILCVLLLEIVFRFTSSSQVGRWCLDDTLWIQWSPSKWSLIQWSNGGWLHNIKGRMLAQIAKMIWCVYIWWRYMNPLLWNMLESCLNWRRYEYLIFHELIKLCLRALYLILRKQAWRLEFLL